MNKNTTLVILVVVLVALFFGTYKKKASKIDNQCINLALSSNNISEVGVKNKNNHIILTGEASQETKEEIKRLLATECYLVNYIDEIIIINNKPKHIAWIDFEIDEFNELITIHGVLKNQQQINDILTVFSQKFRTFNLANDIEFNVLIKRNHELAENLSYLIPLIKTIKVAKIKLSENTLNLEGLVRNSKIESQTINQIKQLFSDELKVINNLSNVTSNDIDIKPLEFSLPTIPLIENNK